MSQVVLYLYKSENMRLIKFNDLVITFLVYKICSLSQYKYWNGFFNSPSSLFVHSLCVQPFTLLWLWWKRSICHHIHFVWFVECFLYHKIKACGKARWWRIKWPVTQEGCSKSLRSNLSPAMNCQDWGVFILQSACQAVPYQRLWMEFLLECLSHLASTLQETW